MNLDYIDNLTCDEFKEKFKDTNIFYLRDLYNALRKGK